MQKGTRFKYSTISRNYQSPKIPQGCLPASQVSQNM
uniref:Uncharacterized protein n=1 Tax=Arundo donax TaxID=35708 RepID=A0A0A8YWK7_ARUDO